MEGYTNIIGGQYDFDDLDIEGRVVDEWTADDDIKKVSNVKGTKQFDESKILLERVKLDNGQQADVFTVAKKKDNVWYTCHVCTDTMVGAVALKQHVDSNKHRSNMSKPVHPRAKFVKLDPKENMSLEPGEPVPPGLEEVIFKSCLIQPKLDAYKASPLIGLEFLVELTQCTLVDEGIYYYCLLCDKTGTERNMLIHLTSIFHYMKYLSIYFPLVARKLHYLPNKKVKKSFGLVVTEIVGDIEAKYGRMKPQSETHSGFYAPGRKAELQAAVKDGPHFSEKDGDTFEEKATAENVDKKTKELQAAAALAPSKNDDVEKSDENKEPSGSLFNKANRINVDKKQLRTREEEEDKNNSSPDVQIVDIQLPKPKSPEKKLRSRSKSLSSISTISSSPSLRNRDRHNSNSRYHTRISRHSRSNRYWSRSRSHSRSPGYRYRRRRSPSPSRHPHFWSRDRSPSRRGHKRRDSRSRSRDSYRSRGVDRYGRSREGRSRERYRREKVSEEKASPREYLNTEEKVRWTKFREELKKIESVKLEKLKYHEKNPEKHPNYPGEWKSFWNRRYNELQRSGVDPSKHDFKPEWISYWTKRMKELYEEDLGAAKDELKRKFDLPEDPAFDKGTPWKHNPRKRNNTSPGLVDVSPPTPEKKDVIADIKSTWKALTGSDLKRPLSPWEEDSRSRDGSPPSRRDLRRHSPRSRSQSPLTANEKLLEDMPQRKTRTSSLIFVLRKLTVLEQQLGSSLAPKVFEILSQSLALEKIKEDASLDLLLEEENCVFLETVREKLIALLCAGVVPRNIVNTARSAIKHIDIALYLASKRQRALPMETLRAGVGMNIPLSSQSALITQYSAVPKSEPVVVPGVGQVDKIAIAQQIAAALIEQGKTNVTEAELEQLINAVVGMAEASVNSTQPMTAVNFLHQLQAMQNSVAPALPVNTAMSANTPVLVDKPPLQLSGGPNPQPQAAFGALKLLQSAYNDTAKPDKESPKPDVVEIADSNPVSISDEDLAATLSLFNKTSREEQPNFMLRLQANNPDMYKRLCPFIPSEVVMACNRSKRSPITIPISKEKSEQKIKPVLSGRLSPFSSRTGGANPAVGEQIIVDDDDKTDAKVISDAPSKPQDTIENQQTPKFKPTNSDVDDDDDDDDDDDYTFEDVYKAAQEKLRQRQLNERKENNQSTATTEISTKDGFESGTLNESKPMETDEPYQSVASKNTNWTLDNQEKVDPVREIVPSNLFATREMIQHRNDQNEVPQHNQDRNMYAPREFVHQRNDQNEIPQHLTSHQNFQQDVNRFSNLPVNTNQQVRPSNPYNTNAPSAYQESMQRRQQPLNPHTDSVQPSFNSSLQSYPVKDQFTNDPLYSKEKTDYYDKNRQFGYDAPYSTQTPYSDSQKDPWDHVYHAPYRDHYSATTNSGYGNTNSYNEQYRYRESTYQSNSYSQSVRPPYPGSSRYPSGSYPY